MIKTSNTCCVFYFILLYFTLFYSFVCYRPWRSTEKEIHRIAHKRKKTTQKYIQEAPHPNIIMTVVQRWNTFITLCTTPTLRQNIILAYCVPVVTYTYSWHVGLKYTAKYRSYTTASSALRVLRHWATQICFYLHTSLRTVKSEEIATNAMEKTGKKKNTDTGDCFSSIQWPPEERIDCTV